MPRSGLDVDQAVGFDDRGDIAIHELAAVIVHIPNREVGSRFLRINALLSSARVGAGALYAQGSVHHSDVRLAIGASYGMVETQSQTASRQWHIRWRAVLADSWTPITSSRHRLNR
jgi:hypothetical protein